MRPMRKRSFSHALEIPKGGLGSEGPACKSAKLDTVTPTPSCEVLKDEEHENHEEHPSEDPKDLSLDVSYWALTHQSPFDFGSLADTASSSSPNNLPLTAENLVALDEIMPSKKDTSAESTTNASVNIARAFQILELNNIFIDNEDAVVRGQDVIQQAKKITQSFRHSQMTAVEAETVRKTASNLSMDDELTFMVGVWKLIIATSRTMELKNEQEKIDYVEKAWEKDNLKCNWGSHFATNIAPPLRFADTGMEAFADMLTKLKNSFPDLTYGYDKRTFTPEQMAVNENLKGELCRMNWHAFLIGEAKSIDLPFEIGVAQAARAAATAIHLRRKLKDAAKPSVIATPKTISNSSPPDNQHDTAPSILNSQHGPQDNQHDTASSTFNLQHNTNSAALNSSGGNAGLNTGQSQYKADRSSFIYTFVISPEFARLFVAWAEEEWKGGNKEPGINYHMSRIRSYYFSEGAEFWAALHHDLDNVLDWGVGPRKTDVLNLLNDIANKTKDGKKRVRP